MALGPATRTPGARLALVDRRAIGRFAIYAKPIVASTLIYLVIGLVDRHLALERFGAAATGKLSLATDLGFRLFVAIAVMPESLLFQYALKRERDEGRAAAERQIATNFVLIFAMLAPLTAGYMAMAPTFDALVVPAAFRGDYARLSLFLAPGFFAFCALYSMCNSVFQLAKRTWPLTFAALAALVVNLVLVKLPFFSSDIDGIAQAYALSLVVGFVAAAVPALLQRTIHPAWRDMIVIAVATGAMAFIVRPLNAIHPPLLAAAASLAVGGAIIAGAILAADVGGMRGFAVERLRILALSRSSRAA